MPEIKINVDDKLKRRKEKTKRTWKDTLIEGVESLEKKLGISLPGGRNKGGDESRVTS